MYVFLVPGEILSISGGIRKYDDENFRVSCVATGKPDLTDGNFTWYYNNETILADNSSFEWTTEERYTDRAPYGLSQEWNNSLAYRIDLKATCESFVMFDGNYTCDVEYDNATVQVDTHRKHILF